MRRWIREIHLALGLFSCAFVLMYSISSLQMVHQWFSEEPTVETRELPVETSGDGRAVARELMERHGLAGELSPVKETETGYEFRLFRTGRGHQVAYDRETRIATVTTRTFAWAQALGWIHRTAGFERNDWVGLGWSAFSVAVSASLLLLGASGIYLWFLLKRERLVGGVLLALGGGGGVLLLALIRWGL